MKNITTFIFCSLLSFSAAYAKDIRITIDVADMIVGQSYKTPKGNSVKRSERKTIFNGSIKGVEINGKFWSDPLPETYTNLLRGTYYGVKDDSDAEKACEKYELYLPTREEFESLLELANGSISTESGGFTVAGREEFDYLMPLIPASKNWEYQLWSSTVAPPPRIANANSVFALDTNSGQIIAPWVRETYGDPRAPLILKHVVCVERRAN